MITIKQLLESVDLDFEPRFVTKDKNGTITVYLEKPNLEPWDGLWENTTHEYKTFGTIKLSEFTGKPWQECIYKVPQKVKTADKIEKIHIPDMDEVAESAMYSKELAKRLNQVIDAVNELKGAKND